MKLTLNKDLIEKKTLRTKRAKLLAAFDIYKSNVNYGAIEETAAEHQQILEWYKSILDLVPSAFDNIPEKIARYI